MIKLLKYSYLLETLLFIKITIYKRKVVIIFDVCIDDLNIIIGSQPITANIVQRIEGRREPETRQSTRALFNQNEGFRIRSLFWRIYSFN